MTWSPAPSKDNLIIPKGRWLFDRWDAAGLPTGYREMGNVSSATNTTADDVVEKYESMTKGAGLYDRSMRRRTQTFRLGIDEVHPDNYALIVMGKVLTLAQTATAVVGEPLAASTVPGAVYSLSKLGPYTAIAVKFGSTSGVINVDWAYVGNPKFGMIKVLPGTTMTGALTVDYTPTAYSGATAPQIVAHGTEGQIAGSAIFLGDPVRGPETKITLTNVTIAPDGDHAVIGDDYVTTGLTLSVLNDTAKNPSAPYGSTLYLP